MSTSNDLRMINYHGWQMVQGRGCLPAFQNQIAHRIHKKMATNIVFTGEPGIGKSYLAIDVARVAEGSYRTASGEIKDRFTIDQVVFTQSDYMDLLSRLKWGKPLYLMSQVMQWEKETGIKN